MGLPWQRHCGVISMRQFAVAGAQLQGYESGLTASRTGHHLRGRKATRGGQDRRGDATRLDIDHYDKADAGQALARAHRQPRQRRAGQACHSTTRSRQMHVHVCLVVLTGRSVVSWLSVHLP